LRKPLTRFAFFCDSGAIPRTVRGKWQVKMLRKQNIERTFADWTDRLKAAGVYGIA
jgi:hypothetical protein